MDLFSQLNVNFKKLINHGEKLRELLLFIKLFVATMMEISKNIFKRGIESNIAFTQKYLAMSPNIFAIWNLLAATKQKHT